MGIRLKIAYRHHHDLTPSYMTNEQVQQLAWDVRMQLGGVSTTGSTILLERFQQIEGAVVNGVNFDIIWDIADQVIDRRRNSVLGMCDYDPRALPNVIQLVANRSLAQGRQALLLSTLAHELGHAVCDAPSWIVRHQDAALPGILDTPQGRITEMIPDQDHLLPKRAKRGDFAEYRANEFMGTLLVPRALLIEPLQYHARAHGVELTEVRLPDALPLGDDVPGLRMGACRGGIEKKRRYELFSVLANLFGVSPRFIHVRLLRYGIVDEDEPTPAGCRRYLPA